MTLRELTLPEGGGISSSTAHGNTVDPPKAKASRRRRLEIQRLKTTCQNGVVSETNEAVLVENEHGACRRKERAHGGAHGVVSVMGRRREMEDAITVEKELIKIVKKKEEKEGEEEEEEEEEVSKYDYYGVYDGHGGSHVAEACRDRMHAVVREEVDTWRKEKGGCDCDGDEKKIDWEGVMERSFRRVDEEVWGGGKVDDMTVGSTAVVAVVGKEEIVVANCGDSRAVVFRGGLALPLSLDHKPDRPDELARIEAAGGRVINWYGFRVSGVLATSRSIGDYHLKPYVSSMPEVTISKRTDADEFFILASDGLWDVITNEVACQVVRRCLSGRIKSKQIFNQINKISGNRAEVAAALLAELAIAKGSKDNISVIVVELKKFSRNTC